jgi:hypothetical protein
MSRPHTMTALTSARTRPRFGAAGYTSAACRLGAPGVGPLDHPPAASLNRGWQPTSSDLTHHAPNGQHLPTRLVVVAGVQVHHRPSGQRPHHIDGVQGRGQQPVVTVVGRCGQHRQRDATRLDRHQALQPLLAPVHWAGPGNLAAAGRLGSAPIHRQVLQLHAEQPVIGGQHQQAQLLGQAQGDPLIAAAAQGRGRAGTVGDPAVAAAEHQGLDELVEDNAVGDAGPVAAQRMGVLASWQQGGDLDPQGFQDRRWQGRHETSR